MHFLDVDFSCETQQWMENAPSPAAGGLFSQGRTDVGGPAGSLPIVIKKRVFPDGIFRAIKRNRLVWPRQSYGLPDRPKAGACLGSGQVGRRSAERRQRDVPRRGGRLARAGRCTSSFFVCWWYSEATSLACANSADWPFTGTPGPGMVRISFDPDLWPGTMSWFSFSRVAPAAGIGSRCRPWGVPCQEGPARRKAMLAPNWSAGHSASDAPVRTRVRQAGPVVLVGSPSHFTATNGSTPEVVVRAARQLGQHRGLPRTVEPGGAGVS